MMFVITAIALVGLVVFAIAAITHFDGANLTNIDATDAVGASNSSRSDTWASGLRSRSQSGSSLPSKGFRWRPRNSESGEECAARHHSGRSRCC